MLERSASSFEFQKQTSRVGCRVDNDGSHALKTKLLYPIPVELAAMQDMQRGWIPDIIIPGSTRGAAYVPSKILWPHKVDSRFSEPDVDVEKVSRYFLMQDGA